MEPLYQLDKEKGLSPETPAAGKAFLETQLKTGAQTLANLWQTAWQEAPPDRFLQTYLAQRQLKREEN